MIIEFRRKVLVAGSLKTMMAEACTLMFGLRRCFKKMGYNEENINKIMLIIALATECETEEEHIKTLKEFIDHAEPDEPFAVYDPD